MTIEHYQTGEWPVANRPQDIGWDGSGLTFEPIDLGRPLPRAIRVTDADGRSCKYVAADTKIVKQRTPRRALNVTTHEHGGDVSDMMAQEIQARDAASNFCRYVPVNPLLAKRKEQAKG